MNYISTIFFDLDHTLWDYEKNSSETLDELFRDHSLRTLLGCSNVDFLHTFGEINSELWSDFNQNLIGKEEIRNQRFERIFNKFGIYKHPLALELSDEYILRCPTKSNLLPYAREMLDYLSGKYDLHILSNGFNDVQRIKLEKSKIRSYFGEVITSESSGHRKPSREIFAFALEKVGRQANTCLMIGDNLEADIGGALNAELTALYFNPLRKRHGAHPHFEINCLSEMRNLL